MSDTVLTALIAAGVPAFVTVVTAILQYRSKKLTDMMKANCAHLDGKLDELRNEMKAGQFKDEQAITRLELMTLMRDDPENVLEIEKLAHRYFDPKGLNGDTYMSKVYSNYAKAYGADYTFVTHL